jgi:hypothetical protein
MTTISQNVIQPASGQALTIKDEGGTASITIQTDGDLTLAENAYLGSGKGIYFDGQTTSANFLDDYEEGTWTPTINPTSGSITTQSAQTGIYQKIGNMVTINFNFKIEDAGSASGAYKVTGLPFTISRYGAGPLAPCGVGYESNATGQTCQVLSNNSSELQVRKYDHTGITNANSMFNCSMTYQTT